MAETKTIEIEVLRYRPEQDKEPFWQSYSVPFTDDWSVLQGCSTSRTTWTAPCPSAGPAAWRSAAAAA